KATKIFIFLITVLLITALVLGFSLLRRNIHINSHKCSGDSCSQSHPYPAPPPVIFPITSTPASGSSNPSDLFPPPPPSPPSGSSSDLAPPPPAPSLAPPPSESSNGNQAPPPPPVTPVSVVTPPPPVAVVAPPPGFNPVGFERHFWGDESLVETSYSIFMERLIIQFTCKMCKLRFASVFDENGYRNT
ncbi:hypothetical protein M8C21_025949, partial [Ambrosia artemisiifolia]